MNAINKATIPAFQPEAIIAHCHQLAPHLTVHDDDLDGEFTVFLCRKAKESTAAERGGSLKFDK